MLLLSRGREVVAFRLSPVPGQATFSERARSSSPSHVVTRDAAVPSDPGPRLRSQPLDAPFHVALLDPEIPQNTGSIARVCAATSSPLHLVGTLGFRIDEKAVRRAGVDYWHLVDVRRHADLSELARVVPPTRWHLLSAKADRSYLDAPFEPGDVLLFGKESSGLPDDVVRAHEGRVWGIPTSGAVRSINLSNAVSVVLFEALRRTGGLANATLR